MKNLKIGTVLLFLIGVISFTSCEKEEFIEDPIVEIDTSKLVNFKGLPVDHRFDTPIEDLEAEHNLSYLKMMLNKMKQKVAVKKGITHKSNSGDFPSSDEILEAAKEIMHLFPYQDILEQDEYETSGLGSIQIADLEQQYQLEQDLLAKGKWEMIKQDFPTLTEQEIYDNIEAIDQYYEQNLDYAVFNEIANNGEEIAYRVALNKLNNSTVNSTDSCFTNLFENLILFGIYPLNIVKAGIAIAIVGKQPQRYAGDYYPDGDGDGGSNTRGDAYRHTIWNALLANNYFTLIAKWKRILFAKQVTDLYESCTDGELDSKTMDYHNNAIGRKIWDDNTSHRKILGIPVALRRPSTARLKELIEKAVNEKSCFIVKIEGDDFPNNELTQPQSISQIKAKIDNTDSNTIVYFEGTIAPSRYGWRYVFSHWEYYDCSDQQQRSTKPNKPCRRPIYIRQWGEIIRCYKL